MTKVINKTNKYIKIIGVLLFLFILFTNIKLSLSDNDENFKGDISILGIELTIFDRTYAENAHYILGCEAIGCSYLGNHFCGELALWDEYYVCYDIVVEG